MGIPLEPQNGSNLQGTNGAAMRNVMQMAVCVAQRKTLADMDEAERSIQAYFKNPSMPSISSQADSEVRRSANESVARNARRDKAKVGYARVPSGVETCKWCIAIAANGPSFKSMEIASHSHPNCDCRVVPDFGDGIQGYDPDYYYDVYKHPENHPEYQEARNARRRELYDLKKMGAINGALNDDNDPYMDKRNAHAVRYYEEVRKRDKPSEIASISRNSGIDGRLVAKAYDHLFVNEYDLGNGYSRFDESYDIAESWRRLREGPDIKAHDIILLQHESLEYDLMSSGMSYSDAQKSPKWSTITQRHYVSF